MLNEWQERSECFGKNSEYRWGFDHRVYKPSPILRKYDLQLPDPADEEQRADYHSEQRQYESGALSEEGTGLSGYLNL
ncbi:hypothetical protein D3C72_2515190 [compost metagenome]